MTNIYSNPDSDSYRQLKVSNRLVVEFLSDYSAGTELLEAMGFRQEGQMWVNGVEIKYLKLFKNDL